MDLVKLPKKELGIFWRGAAVKEPVSHISGGLMKLLHISDLHIGKRMNEFPMIEDQKYILDQICAIAEGIQADGVIIAGDIYDKAVPSAEAVQLFDYFLTRLSEDGRKVFAISGNHDSAERIAFGAKLMSRSDVFVSPVYDGTIDKIQLEDRYGELCIYLLPFLKPVSVRHALEGEAGADMPESYQEAVKAAIGRLKIDPCARNVLAAHQFVTGASRCESEDVVVGGLDNVDVEIFDAFDYVALGHIHSPQSVGRETVRYCGTPLKYSFSEVKQEKSVTVVELKEKGNVAIETVPLVPLHDMREIKGSYLEVTARSFYEGSDTQDYIKATLTDEEDIPDGMQKLRVIYPNLMRLEYDNSRTRQSREIGAAQNVEKKSGLELFEEFYELQNNAKMSEKQAEFVACLFGQI